MQPSVHVRWRGRLHAFVAAYVFPCAFVLLVYATALSWIATDSAVRLAVFLACKLLAYAVSASYHGSHRGKPLSVEYDLLVIPVAVCAPASMFVCTRTQALALAASLAVVMYANARAVVYQFTPGGTSTPRCLVLFAYFVAMVAWIGWQTSPGVRLWWYAGTGCYVLAFVVSPPVHRRYWSDVHAPWHVRARNGWHEDFHVLLGVADLCYAALGVSFALNASV